MPLRRRPLHASAASRSTSAAVTAPTAASGRAAPTRSTGSGRATRSSSTGEYAHLRRATASVRAAARASSARRRCGRDPARLARRRAVRAPARGGDLDQAPRAVDPRRSKAPRSTARTGLAQSSATRWKSRSPATRRRCGGSGGRGRFARSVLLEHALRREIVDEGRRLDAVQRELVERVREDLADCAGREPSAVARWSTQ